MRQEIPNPRRLRPRTLEDPRQKRPPREETVERRYSNNPRPEAQAEGRGIIHHVFYLTSKVRRVRMRVRVIVMGKGKAIIGDLIQDHMGNLCGSI